MGQTQHKSKLHEWVGRGTWYLNTSLNSGSSGTGDYASNYKTPNYTQYTQQDFKGNKSKLSIKSVNPIIFLFQLFFHSFFKILTWHKSVSNSWFWLWYSKYFGTSYREKFHSVIEKISYSSLEKRVKIQNRPRNVNIKIWFPEFMPIFLERINFSMGNSAVGA